MYLWTLNDGFRWPGTSAKGVVVPKGRALPIEFALRGWELGCTSMPYIEETLKIRNAYFKGVPIKLVRIAFDWDVPARIMPTFLERYEKRKRNRAGRTGRAFNPEEITKAKQLCDQAENYWRRRPSVLAYLLLGGELNPTIIRET